MTPTAHGSFRLFQLWGIHVFLHWSWLVIAFYQIERRKGVYGSLGWNVAEYLTLFLIVLIHEFGHALATRQVGGRADEIVLWPLGGVAYVSPPPRPGAELWSIAAGPLVNVVFFVLLTIALALPIVGELALTNPDAHRFITNIWYINTGLLIFNLLPVYPLDGGQILRSILWFFIGPIRSLHAASIVGFVGVAGLAVLTILNWDIWLAVITFFVFQSCLGGWRQARAMAARTATPPPL
jgi:Zn-dependent protease